MCPWESRVDHPPFCSFHCVRTRPSNATGRLPKLVLRYSYVGRRARKPKKTPTLTKKDPQQLRKQGSPVLRRCPLRRLRLPTLNCHWSGSMATRRTHRDLRFAILRAPRPAVLAWFILLERWWWYCLSLLMRREPRWKVRMIVVGKQDTPPRS